MDIRNKIAVFFEKVILTLFGIAIFVRLFLFWFLLSFFGPSTATNALDFSSRLIAIFVYIIFFLFLIKLILQKWNVNFNLVVTIFLLGLLCLSALSLIYSVNKASTLNFIIDLSVNICIFFILYNCLNSINRVKIFISLLLAAGLVASLHALYHYFLIYNYILKNPVFNINGEDFRIKDLIMLKRISGLFGWPNMLAGFLCMLLPLNIIGIKIIEDRREKTYLVIAALVIFFAAILTYSIGGLLGLFISSIISFLLYFGNKQMKINLKSKKSKLILGALALFIILIAAAVINKRANQATAGSFFARTIYLKGAVNMIKDKPILGTGAGTFKDVFSNYIKNPIEYSTHAHNTFLEFWSDLGILGFLLFLSFSIYILYYIGFNLFHEKSKEKRLLLTGLFCSIAAFLFHNMVDFTFFSQMVSFYWWVLLSAAFALSRLKMN